MQHDYSIITQRIFVAIFGVFALVGPVIGVTFSDSFGLRANIAKKSELMENYSSGELEFHEKLFCSDWAGKCNENVVISKIHNLIKG